MFRPERRKKHVRQVAELSEEEKIAAKKKEEERVRAAEIAEEKRKKEREDYLKKKEEKRKKQEEQMAELRKDPIFAAAEKASINQNRFNQIEKKLERGINADPIAYETLNKIGYEGRSLKDTNPVEYNKYIERFLSEYDRINKSIEEQKGKTPSQLLSSFAEKMSHIPEELQNLSPAEAQEEMRNRLSNQENKSIADALGLESSNPPLLDARGWSYYNPVTRDYQQPIQMNPVQYYGLSHKFLNQKFPQIKEIFPTKEDVLEIKRQEALSSIPSSAPFDPASSMPANIAAEKAFYNLPDNVQKREEEAAKKNKILESYYKNVLSPGESEPYWYGYMKEEIERKNREAQEQLRKDLELQQGLQSHYESIAQQSSHPANTYIASLPKASQPILKEVKERYLSSIPQNISNMEQQIQQTQQIGQLQSEIAKEEAEAIRQHRQPIEQKPQGLPYQPQQQQMYGLPINPLMAAQQQMNAILFPQIHQMNMQNQNPAIISALARQLMEQQAPMHYPQRQRRDITQNILKHFNPNIYSTEFYPEEEE
jgi:hypothetical protein